MSYDVEDDGAPAGLLLAAHGYLLSRRDPNQSQLFFAIAIQAYCSCVEPQGLSTQIILMVVSNSLIT